MFCIQDWHKEQREKAAEKLGEEKVRELRGKLDQLSAGMSKEAMAKKAEFEEYQQQVRKEFEKRKAKSVMAEREIFVVEPVKSEENKRSWWRFGF